jgi:hypothetical protein
MKSILSEKPNANRREPLVLIGKSRNIENKGHSIDSASEKNNGHAAVQNSSSLLNSRKEDLHPQSSDICPSFRAKAKFTYKPTEQDELAFAKHEIIDIFGSSQASLPTINLVEFINLGIFNPSREKIQIGYTKKIDHLR